MAYSTDMANIEERLQRISDLLAHSKTMKERDKDADRAFKALHAAVSQLLDLAILENLRIASLERTKTKNGK